MQWDNDFPSIGLFPIPCTNIRYQKKIGNNTIDKWFSSSCFLFFFGGEMDASMGKIWFYKYIFYNYILFFLIKVAYGPRLLINEFVDELNM